MSILTSLRIAANALQVHQKSIEITGHNIANAATKGFSRQRVETVSAFPSLEGRLVLGQGVRLDKIRSVVDSFFESELVSLNSGLGFAEAENRALSGVENTFPVGEGIGIGPALDAFFSALSDLSNNPAGQVERVSLIGRARALGDTLRQTRSSLVTSQTTLDKELNGIVSEVNTLTAEIAKLNGRILSTENGGQQAADFRDQRQIKLQRLSKLTGATVFEGTDGQVTVQLAGLVLVNGTRQGSLDDTNLDSSGFRKVFFKNPGGVSFDATSLFTKGEIGGTLAMRDTELANFLGTLDQLAKTLVDEVNTQHALGFDLNGTAGGNFFTPIGSVTAAAANVQVNSAVVSNPSLIAAAKVATAVPGDNQNALSLVNLQTTTFAALGNKTFKDQFLSLVGDLGAKAQAVGDSADFQGSLLSQTQVRRDGVSGVNVDEEMTNLILFQQAFQAASLLIRKGDDLFQTILEMTR